jgi:hypothetical protein
MYSFWAFELSFVFGGEVEGAAPVNGGNAKPRIFREKLRNIVHRLSVQEFRRERLHAVEPGFVYVPEDIGPTRSSGIQVTSPSPQ